jgi:glutathione S-transferase
MNQAVNSHTLYGSPHSLYTGKVRCYLRKQGIPYREVMPADPSFTQRIKPIIGRGIIPVMLTCDGKIIQDSIDIIDYFEASGVLYPAYPTSPLQRVVAILIEFYGGQVLLKHAMHYRWSYLKHQERFLKEAFALRSGAAEAEKVMLRMQSYLPQLGINERSIPKIEYSYEVLLDILEQHFAHHPYVLGTRPSIADFGLIGPCFAHLARDPVPGQLMKVRSPRVFRWVERMTAPDLDIPEFPNDAPRLLGGDVIPDTLEPLLAHMVEEVFPELTDKLHFLDQWVAEHEPADGLPVSDKPHQRRLGTIESQFRGIPIESGVEPYLVYVLRRADYVLSGLGAHERENVFSQLARRGLHSMLIGERNYSVGRRDHIEVWER